MTSEEEIRMRLGFDASAVQLGTQKMIDAQKKAATDYVAFWSGALKAREEQEIAFDVRSATRANQAALLNRKRAVVQAERQAATNAEIAAGSGGVGWLSGAGGVAGGRAIKATEEVAKEAHGFAGIMRETAVLFREGFRGNFTRMIGSVSLLIGMIGSIAAVIAIGLAAVLALPAYRTWQAIKGEKESANRLNKKVEDAASSQKELLHKLFEHGVITRSEFRGEMHDLENPTQESVLGSMDFTNQYKKQLAKKIADEEQQKALADYHKRREESDKINQQEHNRLVSESGELNDQYDRLARSKKHLLHEAYSIDQVTPTIEDLAGRSYTERLNKQYGKGGRFDVGVGNGPFAGIARQYELAQKQQMWDIVHGNAVFDDMGTLVGGAAYGDKQRALAAHNQLAAAGLETPAMKMEDMRLHLMDIQRDMAKVASACVDDGIKLKDS